MKKGSLKRKADNSDDESASKKELDALISSSDDEIINDYESSEDNDHADNSLNKSHLSSKDKNKKTKKLRVDRNEGKTLSNNAKNLVKEDVKNLVKKNKNDKPAPKKEPCNAGTSVFIKCRYFTKVNPSQFKEMLTEKGFDVKAVYKHPPFCPFGFIDLGNAEAVERAIALFHTTKMHGQIVTAGPLNSKRVTQQERVASEAKLQPITLADRVMYVRNIPFMTSKKNLQDIFPKVETIIIPPCKGNALRDAILIFPSNLQLENAFEMAEGCEFRGHKLSLERINTTKYTKISNGPSNMKIVHDEDNSTPSDMKKSKKSKKLNKTK